MANKKIKFVLSPTGAYNLAYSAGDEVAMEEKQANELIEAGYALPVDGATDGKIKPPTKAEIEKAEAEKAKAFTELKAKAAGFGLVVDEKATFEEVQSQIDTALMEASQRLVEEKEQKIKAANLTVNGAENASDKAAAGAEKRDGVKP